MGTISGEFYRVIDSEGGIKHRSFFPNELTAMVNHFKMDVEMAHLLTRAYRMLGILEGIVRSQPNIEPFLRIGLFCEAQISCAIDGILTNIEGIFLLSKRTDKELMAEKYYCTLKSLKKMPITIEAICGIHKMVMDGAEEKQCGRMRESVFLMHPQYASSSAEYNPPPPEEIPELLEDLKQFIQTESTLDILIKAAMVYYQFETIHPFESRNGRVGRILILLILMNGDMLRYPFLPVSAIMLRERDECWRQFIRMQHFGEFSDWVRFFANDIAASAESAVRQIEAANELRKMAIGNIRSYKKPTETLLHVYNFVEENPIISVDQVSKGLGISFNTAAKNIGILQELEILEKCNEQLRYRLYRYGGLLRIFQFL